MKVLVTVFLSLFAFVSLAGYAPGSPGMVPNWSSAKKVQTGTSFSGKKSPVWFSLASGVLTETYYPTIDKAQIKDAQLLISDSRTFFVEERTQTKQSVEVVDPSLVKLINRDYYNRFKIEHTYFTMENAPVVVDEITVHSYQDGLSYYVLVNTALNNTGFHDNGYAKKDYLYFTEGSTKLRVHATSGVESTSVGYVGYTDGYRDLFDDYKLNSLYTSATKGNIAGTMKLKVPAKRGTYKFYITYSFESSNKSYASSTLSKEKQQYVKLWHDYLGNLKVPRKINDRQKDLYYRSLFTLRVHEDKLHPGALIASLSNPWGEQRFEKPGVFVGGYHLVWPRDLYHVCAALVQAGDYDTVFRALRFLKSIQYHSGSWNFDGRKMSRRGAFPQNVWVSGKQYWGGFQIDQTAYPVHIFYMLYSRANENMKQKLLREFGDMIYLALELINTYGPWSQQERWEENFGIGPSSFSAATSALLLGEKIYPHLRYDETAKTWLTKPHDNIHTWTYTHVGHFDQGRYYVRVAGCNHPLAAWNPNNGAVCYVANSSERVEQTKMIDQGFLKLALLGLVPADDERIKSSVKVINNHIRVKTPNGYGWYRYSHDAYDDETHKGRLWPLLSGEHGRYAIERYLAGDLTWESTLRKVNDVLKSYTLFANEGDMIPEQVWEKTGEGTGAATPLAWSHAEFIKLLWSKELKKNVENLLQ